MAFEMGDICRRTGSVDDKVQPLGVARDHQVVEQPALGIGEERIALPTLLKADHVHRHKGFQRLARIGRQHHLPHVRHVEKTRLLPAPQMLCHHARAVAHGHLPARERHETAPEFLVERAQRQVFEHVGFVHVTPSSGAVIQDVTRHRESAETAPQDAPSVLSPEIVIPSADASMRISSPESVARRGPFA